MRVRLVLKTLQSGNHERLLANGDELSFLSLDGSQIRPDVWLKSASDIGNDLLRVRAAGYGLALGIIVSRVDLVLFSISLSTRRSWGDRSRALTPRSCAAPLMPRDPSADPSQLLTVVVRLLVELSIF